MSYILEALRRAQAERERGEVPGLQAQPLPAPGGPQPRVRKALPGVAAGVLAGVAAAALLLWWRGSIPSGPAVRPEVQMPAAAPAMAAIPPVLASAAAQAEAAPVPVNPPPLPLVVSAPSMPPVPAVAAASAAAADAVPVVRLAQLTAEQRRELPPLAVGGSVWSDSAASRFVLIDGQLLHEGQSLAPGLVLERIAPRSAWLRWRERRIEVPF